MHSVTFSLLSQVEGLAEQVGVEHPRKLISFTLTGESRRLHVVFVMKVFRPMLKDAYFSGTLKNKPEPCNFGDTGQTFGFEQSDASYLQLCLTVPVGKASKAVQEPEGFS